MLDAFGDPTRREILLVLSEGEMSVNELADRVESVGRTAISSHLRVLRLAGSSPNAEPAATAITVSIQPLRRLSSTSSRLCIGRRLLTCSSLRPTTLALRASSPVPCQPERHCDGRGRHHRSSHSSLHCRRGVRSDRRWGLPRWRIPLGRNLQPGVPISVPVELPSSLGGQRVEILGRVITVECPHLVVIAHELPWRGTITIKVRPAGHGQCAVRVIGRVAEDLVTWATRFVVPAAPPAHPELTWRIGLLSSASGPASVFSVATLNMARMAVDEVNADGGILGRHLELVHGDDGTHPGLGAAELVRLAKAGCGVVLANVTSATFEALLPVARRYGVLLLHTLMNEGGAKSDEVFRLGERPMAQASAAIPTLMQATGGAHFYLAGSDYCWPRTMMGAARRVIEAAGGLVGTNSICRWARRTSLASSNRSIGPVQSWSSPPSSEPTRLPLSNRCTQLDSRSAYRLCRSCWMSRLTSTSAPRQARACGRCSPTSRHWSRRRTWHSCRSIASGSVLEPHHCRA